MSKDLKYKKEETKYNDIIKQCKKLLTQMMLPKMMQHDAT